MSGQTSSDPEKKPGPIEASLSQPADVRTVLVVEDDPITAQALRILLRRSGWIVDVVGCVADADAYLDSRTPTALILDLMLPDGDGAVILQRIRAQEMNIRVTVTSATGDLARIQRVKAMKPHAFLRKPIELDDLMNALT